MRGRPRHSPRRSPFRTWSPLVVLLVAFPFLAGFDPVRSRSAAVEEGNAKMKAGKADEALAAYDKAVAELPGDPAVHFDRGTALAALSRFDEAAEEFLHATEAKDPSLKEAAFYNLGNAFFKKDKFKEANEAYKRALALDPKDARAKWNLEIALKKKREDDQKKEQGQGQEGQGQKGRQQERQGPKAGRQATGQRQARQTGPKRQEGQRPTKTEGRSEQEDRAASRREARGQVGGRTGNRVDTRRSREEPERSGKAAGKIAGGAPRAADPRLVDPG